MKTRTLRVSRADYDHLIAELKKPATPPNAALRRAARRFKAAVEAGRIKLPS